MKFYTIFLIRI